VVGAVDVADDWSVLVVEGHLVEVAVVVVRFDHCGDGLDEIQCGDLLVDRGMRLECVHENCVGCGDGWSVVSAVRSVVNVESVDRNVVKVVRDHIHRRSGCEVWSTVLTKIYHGLDDVVVADVADVAEHVGVAVGAVIHA